MRRSGTDRTPASLTPRALESEISPPTAPTGHAAAPGDTIELEAGATFTGPFVLPRKAGPEGAEPRWILVRSAAPPGVLPPEGTRIDPSHAEFMATLESREGPVLSAAPGAHHYRFEGIRIRPAQRGGSRLAKWINWAKKVRRAVNPGPVDDSEAPFLEELVSLGTGAETRSDLPHHIIFDRCYIHGDPVIGARRGIALNSGEATGENITFGGATAPIENMISADIEIRGNHLFKPLRWKRDDPSFGGAEWSVKNLLELKSAERVHIEGNLLENSWPHVQTGIDLLFSVRNARGTIPGATVRDALFRKNVLRQVSGDYPRGETAGCFSFSGPAKAS